MNVGSFILDEGKWKMYSHDLYDGEIKVEEVWVDTPITDVPVEVLLITWESLVNEQSNKEVKLLQLKEYVSSQSFKLEQETDFKELYGKNNADVRKHHVKLELADVFEEIQGLEFGIGWIRQYIPLLKECIRSKQS